MSEMAVATRIAAALLVNERELPIAMIEALPLVDGTSMARLIAVRLEQAFGAQRQQRRISHGPAGGSWEEYLIIDGDDEAPVATLEAAMSPPSAH